MWQKNCTKPDELSAVRLPEHVLVVGGEEAFVDVFMNVCTQPLVNLGLLDEAISVSERALGYVKKSAKEEAVVLGNLGLIYQTRGELDKAEEMHKKALEINEKIGRLEGIASQFGNLGAIYKKSNGKIYREIYPLPGNREELFSSYHIKL